MHLVILFLSFSLSTFAASRLSLETGFVHNAYNNQRIPGDEGTLFDMAPSFDDSNQYYRINYVHQFSDRRGLRLLYAPLALSGSKAFDEDINFQGAVFSANSPTKTEYRFNSYRLSYFYKISSNKNWFLNLGGTLKVRDAKVQLQQNGTTKSKENVGLVPLLYLYSEYRWNSGMRMVLDFDGLVAPQGRAIDAALLIGSYINRSTSINLGYRILEGGADNERVYNFSLFNYYVASVEFNF